MKTERRWLKRVLAETAKPSHLRSTLPWQRGSRRRPAALRVAAKPLRAGAAG